MFAALPTEPIGSIPRPAQLLTAVRDHEAGRLSAPALEAVYLDAIRDTVRAFESTGSPVITDGEQRKYQNFATYAVHGLPNFTPGGFRLQFTGHYREWPLITSGPFRYARPADSFLETAKSLTRRAVKQAVIAPSALSLMYPPRALPDLSREDYLATVIDQHVAEVRACLRKGAHAVQIDFTEGRLACKLDRSGQLLASFITLNNLALDRLTASERARVGVHTCPGGDRDSTHSADVAYVELLPSLFQLRAGAFYVALAREKDRRYVLKQIRELLPQGVRVFVGVIDPLDPRVETVEEVCERVLEAAEHIPLDQLGTTDDCGFSPFADDTSTSRETAFAKIRARVEGTLRASERLFGS